MAELHVQPKRNNYWWLWLLLILIIIAALIYYFNYYQKGKQLELPGAADSTATINNADTTSPAVAPTANLWDQVDFDSPDTSYPEVTDKNLITKSNSHFVIYSEDVSNLFENGKSDLSKEGKQSLDQVASSINKRFNTADVRIYAQSDTAHADQLPMQRGESVSNYLVKNTNIDQSRISVFHPGEGTSVPDKKDQVSIVVKR
ncbi:MAG TPA: OmpA family protein [Hanamia sp.]|nr:OmpA family protein [Hanamia sp.]